MKKTYKYRLYPTSKQTKILRKVFWFCRFLYNSALEERKSFYKKYGKSIGYSSQCKALPEIKKFFIEETENIHSQVLQQTLKQLDVAYRNFFRNLKQGVVSFPRRKNETRFRSICFPQPDSKLSKGCIKRLTGNRLQVSGLGELKVKWHREIPESASVKQVRIVKSADKYYVVISCDNVKDEIFPPTGKTVSIDLGLNSFIMTDKGESYHHPKPYKTAKEKLDWLNRKLALKKSGSNNRRKAIVGLQKTNERIRNIREDFQHKLSKRLVQENDVIVIEKLNIKGLLEKQLDEEASPSDKQKERNHKNNIKDASWGSFAAKLIYKAESAGRKLIEVDPRYTSMTCSCCGNIKAMPQDVRKYTCGSCGLDLDRDLNAARNILRLGTSLAVGVKSTSDATKL